jgi:flagellar hook-associated protein 1 FlgK
MSGFFAIEMLRRALNAQQAGLSTTSHNIANVNTAGFTRQEAVLQTTPPAGGPSLFGTTLIRGTGVEVPMIRQMRDAFVEAQIRDESRKLAAWNVRQDAFEQIGGIFPEPSDTGLGAVFGQFWAAWQELSLNPESTAARHALATEGETLAREFNRTAHALDELRAQMDVLAAGRVARVNELAREISSLNVEISRSEIGNQTANDLRDRRAELHRELSGLVDAHGVEMANGELLVYVQGRQLVGPGGGTELLTPVPGGPGAPTDFRWPDGGSLALRGGDLAETLRIRDVDIPGLAADLDALADGLASAVNALHTTGYSRGTPPATGVAFFSGTTAKTIALSADVAASPLNIAASATGAPGDAGIAIRIAQLRDALALDGGTATIGGTYAALVSRVGVEGREAARQVDNESLLLNQLQQRREAASGVSLDEEMAAMLRFQRAYEAAGRMIRAVDETIETVLNLVGR